MSFTNQDYIDKIRELAFDGPLKKLVKADNCTAQIPVTRDKTQFFLSSKNIVDPSSVSGAVFKARVDNGSYASATLDDAVTGLGSVSSAPTKSIEFMYYFQFFSDSEITSMKLDGLRQIGSYDPTDTTSWTDIAEGLFLVACYYAAAEALRINTQAYVKFYDLTIGGKGLSKNQQYQNIKNQADTYEKKAIQLSDYYYRGQDRQKQPAYARTSRIYPGDLRQPIR